MEIKSTLPFSGESIAVLMLSPLLGMLFSISMIKIFLKFQVGKGLVKWNSRNENNETSFERIS